MSKLKKQVLGAFAALATSGMLVFGVTSAAEAGGGLRDFVDLDSQCPLTCTSTEVCCYYMDPIIVHPE